MAELPHLGVNCSIDDCNLLDFLPFTCLFCSSVFCINHRSPSSHKCPNEPDTKLDSLPEPAESLLHSCSFGTCPKGEVFPVLCPKCAKNFCLQHRHPPDHACEGLLRETALEESRAYQKQKEIESAIQDVSKKQLPTSNPTPSKPQGRKSNETAMKVKLMKMKLKAVGPPGIPDSEKLFFTVNLPKRHTKKAEIVVYLNKVWSVGKAIDWLTSMEQITNKNNIPSAEQIRLFWQSDVLPLSTTLEELLVTRRGLVSGETLQLEFI